MPDVRDELINPNVLFAATEGDFPPFSQMYYDSGQEKFAGIEMSIFAEICQRLGLGYRPVKTAWTDILLGLEESKAQKESDRFDCSSASMDITEERRMQFFMTCSYYESKCVLATLESSLISPCEGSSPEVCWRDALIGKRIVTIEASTFAGTLRALGATVLTTPSVGRAWLDMLLNGAVDGFATEEANALALAADAQAAGSAAVRIHRASPLQRRRKGFAVSFRRPQLFRAIDGVLEQLISEGDLMAALVRDGTAAAAAAAAEAELAEVAAAAASADAASSLQ